MLLRLLDAFSYLGGLVFGLCLFVMILILGILVLADRKFSKSSNKYNNIDDLEEGYASEDTY